MEFPRAREHAIAAIDIHQDQVNSSGPLTPARMIQIANTYGVEKWLESAYEAITERDEIIDEEEAEMIGMKGVLVIMKARETRLRDQIRRVQMSRDDIPRDKTIMEEVKESSQQAQEAPSLGAQFAPSSPVSVGLSTTGVIAENGTSPERSGNVFGASIFRLSGFDCRRMTYVSKNWIPAKEDLGAEEAKPENQQLDNEDEVAVFASVAPDNASSSSIKEDVYHQESSSEIGPISGEHDMVVHSPMHSEQVFGTDVGPSVSGEKDLPDTGPADQHDPLAQEAFGTHWTEVEVYHTILVYNSLKDEIRDWRPFKSNNKAKRLRVNNEKRQRLREIEAQVETLDIEFQKYLAAVGYPPHSTSYNRTQEGKLLLP
ncbi:hypothetical protein AAF712_015202 [Marasmius tenuissimus]|uniref:Uncharacterized protein n=1 Tax=Marasmius tenuissimus TaxID=585030 RepID=A0ABR2Z965_9AGAR